MMMSCHELECATSIAVVHIGIVVMLTGNGTAAQTRCALEVTILHTKVINLATAQTGEKSALAVRYDLDIPDDMVVTVE